MTPDTLRRYTSLSSAIHILRTRTITLTSPDRWDDQNDAYFLDTYKTINRGAEIVAMCFAECHETYHHWRIYAGAPDGVRIDFKKLELIKHLDASGVLHDNVQYCTLNEAKAVTVARMPFIKRVPFSAEKEYRAVKILHGQSKRGYYDVPISLECIDRISLSPWTAGAVRESVKAILRLACGDEVVQIYNSTLISNDQWKATATGMLFD